MYQENRIIQRIQRQLGIFFCSLFIPLCAYCGPINVSTDTDLDGLKDLDEVSVMREVSAGPSDDSILAVTTGICIANGDSLLFRATGSVSANTSQGPTSGPAGTASEPVFPAIVPDAPYLALIGRVGQGDWFLIGEELLFDSTQEGEIHLAVNEVPGSFSNNSGSFSVELGRGLGTDLNDPDTDKDGVLDGADGAPLDPLETLDTDGDGLGNRVDPDDDNDGIFDSEEIGGMVAVNATGNPANIPVFHFPNGGLHLQPGETPIFSATGVIADPAIDATSTPNGRNDLSISGLVLTLPGSPLYRLLARFGNGEWVPLGEEFIFGYATGVSLSNQTHHLGDNTADGWEVPLAEGTFINFPFTLDGPVLGAAVLSIEVFDSRENNRILLNGQSAGRLCSNPDEVFMTCEIPLPPGFFQSGENLLQIVAGEDNTPLDPSTQFDDFQIRNATIDFLPAPYRFIELSTHHLGDAVVEAFEVPVPEGTSFNRNFHLTHKPIVGEATLFIDAYDVTSNRPPLPVSINDVQVGTLCERDPAEVDYWDHCQIAFDVSLLKIGTNNLRVDSVQGGQNNDFDDFMIRLMTLQLPYESGDDEVVFSYNERIGQYADNTGLYTVTIGSGTTSNPLKSDTDDDGIDDKTEVDGGLDPNDFNDAMEDPDNDRLTNLREVEFGTEFFNPDTDGDRVGDGAEVDADTDPTDRFSPMFFDYIPDGVVDVNDYLKLVLNWHLEVEDLSFDKVGDLDDSGRIDNQDVLFYQEGIFR